MFAGLSPDASAQAVLVVETAPPGATVRVDGEVAGRSPVTLSIAPGRHTVTAEAAGFVQPPPAVVDAVAGDTLTVALRLTPETGRVRIDGVPAGATIETPGWDLDGEAGEVPVGTSTLLVRSPEGYALQARLEVRAGRETVVRYQPSQFQVGAFLSNAFLPGSVQVRDGRPGIGLAYGAGVGTALATAAVGTLLVVTADGDFDDAVAAYQAARDEGEAVALWADVETRYDRTRSTRSFRTGALVTAAAVYAVAFLDGALFHSRRPVLEVSAPTELTTWEVGAGAEGLALRYRF